jgi:hypothetical protein
MTTLTRVPRLASTSSAAVQSVALLLRLASQVSTSEETFSCVRSLFVLLVRMRSPSLDGPFSKIERRPAPFPFYARA